MTGARPRVLICEDSRTYAAALQRVIEHAGDIDVVAISRTAEEAIAAVARLAPDLVTMDIELPGMSGLEAVERIMGAAPVPILVSPATSVRRRSRPRRTRRRRPGCLAEGRGRSARSGGAGATPSAGASWCSAARASSGIRAAGIQQPERLREAARRGRAIGICSSIGRPACLARAARLAPGDVPRPHPHRPARHDRLRRGPCPLARHERGAPRADRARRRHRRARCVARARRRAHAARAGREALALRPGRPSDGTVPSATSCCAASPRRSAATPSRSCSRAWATTEPRAGRRARGGRVHDRAGRGDVRDLRDAARRGRARGRPVLPLDRIGAELVRADAEEAPSDERAPRRPRGRDPRRPPASGSSRAGTTRCAPRSRARGRASRTPRSCAARSIPRRRRRRSPRWSTRSRSRRPRSCATAAARDDRLARAARARAQAGGSETCASGASRVPPARSRIRSRCSPARRSRRRAACAHPRVRHLVGRARLRGRGPLPGPRGPRPRRAAARRYLERAGDRLAVVPALRRLVTSRPTTSSRTVPATWPGAVPSHPLPQRADLLRQRRARASSQGSSGARARRAPPPRGGGRPLRARRGRARSESPPGESRARRAPPRERRARAARPARAADRPNAAGMSQEVTMDPEGDTTSSGLPSSSW